MEKTVDGKLVRKFLFNRYVVSLGRNFPVMVEGYNKDHALNRLCDHYTYFDRQGWDFVDELDHTHTVGMLGESLPLRVMGER